MGKRCGQCGSTAIESKPLLKPVSWKDFPGIVLGSKVSVPQCTKCGELILSMKDLRAIDVAAESFVTECVASYLKELCGVKNLRQTEIASRIGVTPEYLSELKHSRKPSYGVFNLLRVMAASLEAFDVISSPVGSAVKSIQKMEIFRNLVKEVVFTNEMYGFASERRQEFHRLKNTVNSDMDSFVCPDTYKISERPQA